MLFRRRINDNPKRSNISGSCGEDIAAAFLEKKKYKILKRNFSVHNIGEIDIIAQKDGYIVFVEVKTRKSDAYGTGAEFVNIHKQRRVRRTAECYLNNMPETYVRFDVIEVYGEMSGNKFKESGIYHIENAF